MKHKQDYFDRAASWAVDTQTLSARSRRTAWTIAGVIAGIAVFEAVALAMLAPLKTVQPVTLLVDRQTGYVQALDPTHPSQLVADEALTQSFLAQYVIAREAFDRATISADYRKVALWSSGSVRTAYLAQMPATNPASPFNRNPAGTVVAVRVKSVSKLGQGIALVRWDTQSQDRNGRLDVAQPWISVVRYRYSNAPMSLDDRLVNPLGFQVLSYRHDPEAIAPQAAPEATSPAPAGPGWKPVAALTSAPEHVAPAITSSVRVTQNGRIVPLNQLPMGSPLSPNPGNAGGSL